MDTLCPLKSISSIITKDNVFVNLQADISPAQMFWDYNLKKYWEPFLLPYDKEFGLENFNRIESGMKYEETNANYVNQLKRRIKLYLAKMIEEERRNNPQSKNYGSYMEWDRKISEEIEQVMLTAFENFKYSVRIPNFRVDYDPENRGNTQKANKEKEQKAKQEYFF